MLCSPPPPEFPPPLFFSEICFCLRLRASVCVRLRLQAGLFLNPLLRHSNDHMSRAHHEASNKGVIFCYFACSPDIDSVNI